MIGMAAQGYEEDRPAQARQGAALWFTGLPGCGKSSLAGAVYDVLKGRGLEAVWLQMDARRKSYSSQPSYSEKERRQAYKLFAQEAAALAEQGRIVLMDASAPEKAMRQRARKLVPRFAEVFLRCDVATAMAREAQRKGGLVMAGLYAKAMKRKATGEQFQGLGQVIGVDLPFEEDPQAELVLDAGNSSIQAMRERVLDHFAAWLG